MKEIFLILALSFSVTNLQAAEKIELQNWIVAEGTSLDEYLDQIEASTYALQMKTIQVRMRATYGVEVPFFAKAKVRPEIEFYFER
ncbi:MAG: hypothetical protein COW00_07585 [Bdellovibrio sp. CG12_big_fil_rev_8_21_14_0_65_39_13]|nr:MAG: hypothetical protein COW78_12265 [Bdellovibrio sp. CG22_combo_CG10-13_8_21_14_all_39_27]PIQ60117.1 MAG: hypothetical protein COW00_07585 [Bdellovibrio sp. CG12_big_fil_rev_8_21_14_0_65_39_13]